MVGRLLQDFEHGVAWLVWDTRATHGQRCGGVVHSVVALRRILRDNNDCHVEQSGVVTEQDQDQAGINRLALFSNLVLMCY
jgi:hypothetical protein